jgi:hypothetical protein
MKTRLLFSALLLALSAGAACAQVAPAPDYTYRVNSAGTAGWRATITAYHGAFHYRDLVLTPRYCTGNPGTPDSAAAEMRVYQQASGPWSADFRVPMSGGGANCELFIEFDLKDHDRPPIFHEVDTEMPGQGQKPRMKEVPDPTDLAAADPVLIGPAILQWGDQAAIPATQATRRRNGVCYFPYRHLTLNAGPGHAEGTSTSLRLNGPTGSLLAYDDLPALQPLSTASASGMIGLPSGSSIVVIEVDAPDYVPESSETNNLRRVLIDVQGSCD